MKKWVLVILSIALLVGCGDKKETNDSSAYSTQPNSKYAETTKNVSDSQSPAYAICSDNDMETCMNFYTNNCDSGDYVACLSAGVLHLWQDDFVNVHKYTNLVCETMDTNTPFISTHIDNRKQEIALEQLEPIRLNACKGAKSFSTLLSYKDSCDSNDPLGCYNLAAMYIKGDGDNGIKPNAAKSVQYFQKACELDLAKSCVDMGMLYAQGGGDLQQSYKIASQYFTKACDLGEVKGCLNLAIMYKQGRGVPQSQYSVASYYCKACRLGDQESCDKFREAAYGIIFKGDDCE